jgi:hypothetical protein
MVRATYGTESNPGRILVADGAIAAGSEEIKKED